LDLIIFYSVFKLGETVLIYFQAKFFVSISHDFMCNHIFFVMQQTFFSVEFPNDTSQRWFKLVPKMILLLLNR